MTDRRLSKRRKDRRNQPSTRVSDPNPFHTDPDPDPGFQIFADPDADPDPGVEIFADPDWGLDLFQKLLFFT